MQLDSAWTDLKRYEARVDAEYASVQAERASLLQREVGYRFVHRGELESWCAKWSSGAQVSIVWKLHTVTALSLQAKLIQFSSQLDARERGLAQQQDDLTRRHEELDALQQRGDEVNRSLLDLKAAGEKTRATSQLAAARALEEAKAGWSLVQFPTELCKRCDVCVSACARMCVWAGTAELRLGACAHSECVWFTHSDPYLSLPMRLTAVWQRRSRSRSKPGRQRRSDWRR